jgi:hypothetical protein
MKMANVVYICNNEKNSEQQPKLHANGEMSTSGDICGMNNTYAQ